MKMQKRTFKQSVALVLAGMMLMGSAVTFANGKEFPSITLKLPAADGKSITEQTFKNLKISDSAVAVGKIAFTQEALDSYKAAKGLKATDKVVFSEYLTFIRDKATTDMVVDTQVMAAKIVVGNELTPEKIEAKIKQANGKVDQLKALVPKLIAGGGKDELAKVQAILGKAVNNPKEILKQIEVAKKQVEALKKQQIAFELKLKAALAKEPTYTTKEKLVGAIAGLKFGGKRINQEFYAVLVSAGSEGFDFTQFTYSGL